MNLTIASLYAVFVSASYVLAIYFGQYKEGLKSRNHPEVIKRRLRAVSIVTLLQVITVPIYLSYIQGISWRSAFVQLRLVPGLTEFGFQASRVLSTLSDCVKVVLLLTVLFVGPIWVYLYDSSSDGSLILAVRGDLEMMLNDIQCLRDYAVSPLTEEVMYTSAILSIFLPFVATGDTSVRSLILITPLLFGLAHAHHSWHMYRSGQHKTLPILVSLIVQLSYTSVFGIFTNFVFLRTASIWPCVTAHIFCNLNGFPQLQLDATRDLQIAYYLMLLLGVIGFKKLLFPLTETAYCLI